MHAEHRRGGKAKFHSGLAFKHLKETSWPPPQEESAIKRMG